MKRDNVIETVVQLMRLTRENKIKWERASESNSFLNTYVGQLDELKFKLKEVAYPDPKELLESLSFREYIGRGGTAPWYRLIINDSTTSEEVIFPLSQGVNDLGDIVANKTGNAKVLNSITERLKAL